MREKQKRSRLPRSRSGRFEGAHTAAKVNAIRRQILDRNDLKEGNELQQIHDLVYSLHGPVIKALDVGETDCHPKIIELHLYFSNKAHQKMIDEKYCPIKNDPNVDAYDNLTRYRTRIFKALNHTHTSEGIAVNLFMIALVVYTLLDTIYQSVYKGIERGKGYDQIRFVVDLCYIVEYVIRFLTIRPTTILSYAIQIDRVVELLSIIPIIIRLIANDQEVIDYIIGGEMMFRSLRLTRIMELPSLADPMSIMIMEALKLSLKRYAASIITIILISTASLAGIIYQSETFGDKYNLIDAMWLGFITMSTVGYGDYYATTIPGRCVTFLVSIYGLIQLSLVLMVASQTFTGLMQDYIEEMFDLREDVAAHGIENFENYTVEALADMLIMEAIRIDYEEKL